MNPFDNMDHLINILTTAYEQRGDPVIDWRTNSLQFKIIGPLAGFDGEVANNQDEEEKKDANDGPKLT